jgi:hypothetical protein
MSSKSSASIPSTSGLIAIIPSHHHGSHTQYIDYPKNYGPITDTMSLESKPDPNQLLTSVAAGQPPRMAQGIVEAEQWLSDHQYLKDMHQVYWQQELYGEIHAGPIKDNFTSAFTWLPPGYYASGYCISAQF